MVGMARFELATSCSRSRRANQAALHPDAGRNSKTNTKLCKGQGKKRGPRVAERSNRVYRRLLKTSYGLLRSRLPLSLRDLATTSY